MGSLTIDFEGRVATIEVGRSTRDHLLAEAAIDPEGVLSAYTRDGS